jgi:hypothetical protein
MSPLKPGNYVFSNVQHTSQIIDFAMEQKEDRYSFAFVHGDFKSLRLFPKNSSPSPVVISGVIKKILDDGCSVIADITLENVARTWYTVTLQIDDNPLPTLPKDFQYVFMMGPPEDGESATFVKLENIKLSKGQLLKFNVSRTDETAILYLALDMITRGFTGKRMAADILSDPKGAAKLIAGISGNINAHTLELISAVRNRDMKSAGELSRKIIAELSKKLFEAGKNEITTAAMTEAGKQIAKDMITILSRTIEAVMAADRFKLMGELAGFTYDAPLSGDCSIEVHQ